MTYLRHYTSLPALFRMLSTRELFFGDPGNWTDKNDANVMMHYKNRVGARDVRAVCFTSQEESIYHWEMYSKNSTAVCCEFDRSGLERDLAKVPGVRAERVKYVTLPEFANMRESISALPFVKRSGFRAEREYRFVWTAPSNPKARKPGSFRVASLRGILLSPKVREDDVASLKDAIRRVPGWQKLPVRRSLLLDHPVFSVGNRQNHP